MRIWHYKLLRYLPDAQLKGQLREVVAIMRDWRDKGYTNHLLINKVVEYDKGQLTDFFFRYKREYILRFGKPFSSNYDNEFKEFSSPSKPLGESLFDGWHDKDYLRMCMANLYEKHKYGVGKSKITESEWKLICQGYYDITCEEYKL